MVDVLGHFGMALLWLAPAWYFLDAPRTAATFVGASVWFGMLPDVDLVLSTVVPTVQHHGVFHTVLVVTLLAAVLGPALGWLLAKLAGGTAWLSPRATHEALAIGTIGVWVASLSHLFADVLSAPDVAQAIEPFWPLVDAPIIVDVLWYNSFWATWALLAAGVAVNAVLWYWKAKQSPSGGAGASAS